MSKRVLDVGNCAADQASIRALVESYNASVTTADDADEALRQLRDGGIDLVLVNRILDREQSEGLALIRRIKADPQLAATPCMLITNFSEHQQRAVAAGAEPGFGKRELSDSTTREKLSRFLGAPSA